MNPEPLWDLHQPVETYLSEQGFQIIGRDEQMKALGSESLDDALRGEPGKFCTVARVLGARYVLVGLASGNIADADGVPCIREVQVRFVHTPTTRVISAVSARPGDLTGRCQERLDLVGRALAQRVLDDQKRLADADGSGVLVEISGIRHFDDLKDLIQSLSEVPGVSSVSIEYASTGRSMGLRLLGDVRPEMLGNALNGAVMPHFRVGLEGVEGNRVRVKCIY